MIVFEIPRHCACLLERHRIADFANTNHTR